MMLLNQLSTSIDNYVPFYNLFFTFYLLKRNSGNTTRIYIYILKLIIIINYSQVIVRVLVRVFSQNENAIPMLMQNPNVVNFTLQII